MARHPYPLQYVRLRQAVTDDALQQAIDQEDSKATYRSESSASWTPLITLIRRAATAGVLKELVVQEYDHSHVQESACFRPAPRFKHFHDLHPWAMT